MTYERDFVTIELATTNQRYIKDRYIAGKVQGAAGLQQQAFFEKEKSDD